MRTYASITDLIQQELQPAIATDGTVWLDGRCMGLVEPNQYPRPTSWSGYRWPGGVVDYGDWRTFDRRRDAVAWVAGLDAPAIPDLDVVSELAPA